MFDLINQYYHEGYYQKSDLSLFISVGWITPEQENEILGSSEKDSAMPN